MLRKIVFIGFAVFISLSIKVSAQNDTFDFSKEKTNGKALRLSVIGTIVPAVVGGLIVRNNTQPGKEENGSGLALCGFGLLIGPSLGNFYAGNTDRAFGGIGTRVAIIGGTALFVSGLDLYDGDGGAAIAFSAVGCAFFISSVVCDIAAAGRQVGKSNKNLFNAKLSINPIYFAEANTPGLNVTMNF